MDGEKELVINELDSEEGFFDDYEPTSEELSETTEESVEEPVEESTEESAEETTTVEETESEETQADPYELDVKFNGEERMLSKDEARVLAQKGLNYDRFYEPLERLAKMNNMSVGDYINQLNDTQIQYEVEKEKETLRSDPKYEDLSDEILEEIAQGRVKDFVGQRDQYYAEQTQKEAEAQRETAQREIEHFFEEYPEYRDKGPESLDPKVFEFVGQGYTLLEAYNKFQRMNAQKSQAEAKAKVSNLNEANKKKSLGNTTNAGSTGSDNFLDGFFNS